MLKSNGWGTGIEEELVVLDYGDSGGMGREYVSLWDNSGQIAFLALSILVTESVLFTTV